MATEDTLMRDIYTIQIHRMTNAENRSPNCEVCKNGVIHLSSLQVRQFSQSGKLPNVCKVCNKEFLKVCRMQIRHLTQPDSQQHVCDVCQKTFIHAGNLRKHKLQHHVSVKKSDTTPKADKLDSTNLQKSLDDISFDNPEKSNSAEEGTDDMETISIKLEKTQTFKKNICYCKLCSKQFKDELCFTRHCQVHGEKQNFYCSYCKKSFDSKSALRAHSRDEHEMKHEYICNICCSVYGDMILLKDHCVAQHNNIANGENSTTKDILGRPIFTCEQCDKHFIQKVAYERHCKVHEGSSPLYTCNICHKSYVQHGRLQMHQRLHRKKFFSCKVCNKSFQQKAAYLKHCDTHLDEEEEEQDPDDF